MCSTRRSVASRTVRVTRELCGLECRHGGLTRRGAAADDACGRERDRQARECADRMQREHDRVLLAHRERCERPLDEQDECDADERAQRELGAMNGTRRDHERHHREDVNDPPQTVARDRPALPTRDVSLVDPVRYQSDRQGERYPTDEPRVSPSDRTASPSYRLGAWLGFGGRRARALEREERGDVRRRATEAPYA